MPSETNPEFDSCGHPYTGRVSWPADLVRTSRIQIMASIYTCARPDCFAAASEWVHARTGHHGVYVEGIQPAAIAQDTGRTSIGALYRNGVIRSYPQYLVVCTCHHEPLWDVLAERDASFDTAESALHSAVHDHGWVLLDDGRLLCTGTTARRKPQR